jgi:LysM repeat protein
MIRNLLRAFIAAFVLALLISGTARGQFTPECWRETYVVQPGDTLYSIAEKCDIGYMGLVGINYQLSSPDKIWPGQVIRLEAGADIGPAQPATGPAVPGGLQEGGIYLVRPGDSLARIAYLHNTTVEVLIYLNPEVAPRQILYTGQRIKLPEDARLEKGWVGVNTLLASRAERIIVRIQDFPPYAALAIYVGEMDEDGRELEDPTLAAEVTADARGDAEVRINLPLFAWYDEVWAFEVVTVGAIRPVRALSPAILIE